VREAGADCDREVGKADDVKAPIERPIAAAEQQARRIQADQKIADAGGNPERGRQFAAKAEPEEQQRCRHAPHVQQCQRIQPDAFDPGPHRRHQKVKRRRYHNAGGYEHRVFRADQLQQRALREGTDIARRFARARLDGSGPWARVMLIPT
jgi:hypothetical protein